MRDLITILDYSFENLHNGYDYRGINRRDIREDIACMTVPLSYDRIEVPSFALPAFEDDLRLRSSINHPDKIVATLCCDGAKTTYKSLEAVVRDAFIARFSTHHLIRIPEAKDTPRKYYITQGAIFDENFNPIAMITWEMQKIYIDDVSFKYRFLRPLLRVHPEIVINKGNSIERFIVNKLIPNVLSIYRIDTPSISSNNLFENQYGMMYKAKIVIDKMPFPISRVDTPSISTTNDELLDIALANLEEIAQ